MIYIYDKKTPYAVAMRANGLYTLDKLVISAETTEDISGNYELSIELELQGDAPVQLYEMLQADNIIKVNDEGAEELFRIAQVNKGLDTIELYCRHITIADSLNLWLDNVKPTDLNGAAALQWLAARTVPKCKILFSSNIANVSTADYVRKNLYEALFEGDNAFIKRWGGEVKRTGYTVRIDDKIGQDKTDVIKIKEALNLTEFNAKTNIDEVTTVIYPIGFDGITAPRVVSKLVNNYSMEFPAEIKYEDVKVRKVDESGQVTEEGFATEEEARAELKRRAEAEFNEKHIDQLQFVCDIDFLDLNKFEEYKSLSQLQTANLGDYVSVRVETFDLDIDARIVARKFDVLRGQRIENTLSTDGEIRKPEKIEDIIKDLVNKEVNAGEIKDLSGYIDSMIQQGFKNGYVIYDKNACYAVDKLPKEQAKNVVVLNKNGLGYSSTGINGPYKYGFTIDGKLNADMITTGTLGGQYIKAGSIEADKLTVSAKNEIRDGLVTTEKATELQANIDGVNLKVTNTVSGYGNLLKNGVLMGVSKPIGWTMSEGLNWGRYNERNAGIYPDEIGSVERHLFSERIPRPEGGFVSLSATITAEYNTYGAQLYLIGSTDETFKYEWAHEAATWTAGEYARKSSPKIWIPENIKYIWVRVDHEGKKEASGAYYVYIDWINLVTGNYSFNDYGLFSNGVNSKVSNLVVEADRISARVEEVNKDKDAKFSDLKITTDGINTTVGNVKNNLGQLESNFTNFKQSADRFEFNIRNRGTANLVKGANGLKAYHDGNWSVRKYDTNLTPLWDVINSSTWAYPDATVGTFQLRVDGGHALTQGDMGIIQHNIKVEVGVKYVFSCYVAAHRANSVFCYVRGRADDDYQLVGHWAGVPKTGGGDRNNWTYIEVPFTAERDIVHIEIGLRNSSGADPYAWFAKPMLNKGAIAAEFTDSEREIHSGITRIDANGIRCDFDGGTYAEMGRNGFAYKHASWAHPYQYITKVLKVAKKRNGYWHKFYLGDEFKGKQIDRDFKLTHYIGAVDCNAYVETGQYGGALRTSFTEVRNWNPNEASIEARCCIQKITLKTEVFFGWDKATTDTHKGGIIGESAGDIIIIAQM